MSDIKKEKNSFTEEEYKKLVNWEELVRQSSCKKKRLKLEGEEKPTKEEGHDDCPRCFGNYFLGGQCNFGAHHTLAGDLAKINQNFKVGINLADKLESLKKSIGKLKENQFKQTQQELITAFENVQDHCKNPEKFLLNTCIGIDAKAKKTIRRGMKQKLETQARNIDKLILLTKQLTFNQVKDYQDQLNQFERLGKEENNLAAKHAAEKDPTKKKELWLLLSKNREKIQAVRVEIMDHSLYQLTSEETLESLRNFKGVLFGSSTFIKKKESSDPGSDKQKFQESWLKTKWKQTKSVGGLVLLMAVLWFVNYVLDWFEWTN